MHKQQSATMFRQIDERILSYHQSFASRPDPYMPNIEVSIQMLSRRRQPTIAMEQSFPSLLGPIDHLVQAQVETLLENKDLTSDQNDMVADNTKSYLHQRMPVAHPSPNCLICSAFEDAGHFIFSCHPKRNVRQQTFTPNDNNSNMDMSMLKPALRHLEPCIQSFHHPDT